jgi:Predicted secreted protein
MKKFLCILIVFLLFTANTVYASGGVVCTGSDLSREESEGTKKQFNIQGGMQVTITKDDEKKYFPDLGEDKLGTKSVAFAYVESSGEGGGIKAEASNMTCISSEMLTQSLITAGVKDINIKVSSPYNISGYSSLPVVIKAYEQLSGTTISDEARLSSGSELEITGNLGLRLGMQKALQFVNEIKKEIIKMPSFSMDGAEKAITNQEKRFNISLDASDRESIISMMEKVKKTGLTLESMSAQQKNISTYLNDLSRTANKDNLFSALFRKVMLFLKNISMVFTKGRG